MRHKNSTKRPYMDLDTQIRRLQDVFGNKPKCRALDGRTGQSAKDSLDLLQLVGLSPALETVLADLSFS